MSDASYDAYREPHQIKGFGWWPSDRQVTYLQELWASEVREDWMLSYLVKHKIASNKEIVEAYSKN